jgi:multidrug efflux system membrane fusion protein
LERSAPPTAPIATVPVVAGTVSSHDVPIYLSGVGTVIAYNTVLVRSQIQGQITKIAFNEGQSVHAGDLLAEIDPRPYHAQVDQMIATRDRDLAQLANAQVDIGNITHPSDPNGLVVVTQVQPISVIFTLPETVLPQIQQRQEKTKTPLKVLAYSQDNAIKLDEGELALVNNQIIQTTGSVQLKANFSNQKHRLWPGQLINARLLLDTRHEGLTVPASVVQRGPKGAYAYVIDADDTVAIRPVTVAQISEGQALIDSGLKANEQVVVDGQYKLQPGTHVTILHGEAAEEAAAQSEQQSPIP